MASVVHKQKCSRITACAMICRAKWRHDFFSEDVLTVKHHTCRASTCFVYVWHQLTYPFKVQTNCSAGKNPHTHRMRPTTGLPSLVVIGYFQNTFESRGVVKNASNALCRGTTILVKCRPKTLPTGAQETVPHTYKMRPTTGLPWSISRTHSRVVV